MAFHCRTQQGLTDGESLAEIEKARGDIASRKVALAHRKPITLHAESATETASTKHRGQHHDSRIERTTPIESGSSDESIESPDGALFEANPNEDSGETTVYTSPYRQSVQFPKVYTTSERLIDLGRIAKSILFLTLDGSPRYEAKGRKRQPQACR